LPLGGDGKYRLDVGKLSRRKPQVVTCVFSAAKKIRESKNLILGKCCGIEMVQVTFIDIDDALDWKLVGAAVVSKLTWRDGF
jgi:hypothetical protein